MFLISRAAIGTALSTMIGLALLASTASATTILPTDPSKSVDQAELIFMGRVVDSQFVVSGDGKYPFTFVTFEILDTFKGRTDGTEITLRFDGGDVAAAQERLEVVGMPTFDLGDEALLFVAGNGKWGCPIVGWWQGRLDVINHPRTGAPMLVSHTGAPVEGVSRHTWETAELRYNAEEKRLVNAEPRVQLLRQEGVTILEERAPRKAYAYEGVAVESVFDQLRALIEVRRLQKSFVPEGVVESASPYDVPHSVIFDDAGL